MSLDLHTLRRVLRQLADAGCRDVLLEGLTAEEAVLLARAARLAGTGTGTGTGSGRERAGGAGTGRGMGRGRGRAGTGGQGHGEAVAPRSAAAVIREAVGPAGGDAAPPGAGPGTGPAGQPNRATACPAPSGPGTDAGEERAAAAALGALLEPCTVCRACRLHESRRNVVFGEGSATADVVVVGEAPGQEEDRTGRPFVGRAGKLLDLLLMTAGFARESVYICNVLKCRPPQNRNPLPDEVAQCTTTFLHPQLDTIAPRVLIAVGKFAAQALLESEESIGRLRGRIHTYRGTPLIVTYHPAFLLRSPRMCRVAWHDFQLLRQVYDEQG